MINAIIIEDEVASQEVLLKLLHDSCLNVEIVGIANNLVTAQELIMEKRPHLAFLDVDLGNENGLDLFKLFPDPSFDVIFTTAYQEYALNAIKYSCLDYLLKPIDVRELQSALRRREHSMDKATQRLIQNMACNLNLENAHKLIAIPNMEGFEFVKTGDIVMAKADGNYSQIFTVRNEIMSTRTLGEYENLLPKNYFFRSHKSFLINWSHIKKYNRQDNLIVMKKGLTAELALRRKEEFINYIQHKQSN